MAIVADDLPRLTALLPAVKIAVVPLLSSPHAAPLVDHLLAVLAWPLAQPLAVVVIPPEPPPPRLPVSPAGRAIVSSIAVAPSQQFLSTTQGI